MNHESPVAPHTPYGQAKIDVIRYLDMVIKNASPADRQAFKSAAIDAAVAKDGTRVAVMTSKLFRGVERTFGR